MAHIVPATRPVVVPDPTKAALTADLVFQFDSDPSGAGTLVSFPVKITSYTVPEPEYKTREEFYVAQNLLIEDISIPYKVAATEFEMECSEIKRTEVLALVNARTAVGAGCFWGKDPRDASNKASLSTNAFGVSLFISPEIVSGEFAKVKIKGKITSPLITWTADTTLT